MSWAPCWQALMLSCYLATWPQKPRLPPTRVAPHLAGLCQVGPERQPPRAPRCPQGLVSKLVPGHGQVRGFMWEPQDRL